MRILSRYVFREILSSTFLGTVLATFVIFLQSLSRLFELLVKVQAKLPVVLELLTLALPPILLLSLPFGVLVGILIGLGRMSSDNEMVAMRSAGVSTRRIVPPVLRFALLATVVSAACSLYLNPLAIRTEYRLLNRIGAATLTSQVQPRIFEEQFSNDNTVLYVADVKTSTGPVTVWNGVFIADLTPASERKTGLKDPPTGPLITIAREAMAVPDSTNNRIQLYMRNVSTHQPPYHTMSPAQAQVLDAQKPKEEKAKPFSEMFTLELVNFIIDEPANTQDGTDARIELHRRLALPVACFMLALVGIPLGASSRKGGRSAGYVWGIFLAFFCYYLSFISLTGLAHRHTLPVETALWLPNMVFFVAGIILIYRMEKPGDRDVIGTVTGLAARLWSAVSGPFTRGSNRGSGGFGIRIVIFQLMDNYVLSNFVSYFVMVLFSFIAMTQVFTFFELLGDILKNHIPMSRVLTYHIYLTPKLIYDTLPISVLVSVLVTFGVMTKNNEVTAFKASGISVRRLGLPVLAMSLVLSGGLFAFDHYYIPKANRIQDAIRNEIKGRNVQTYLHPERKWVIHDNRVYYFKYFDPAEKVMVEPYVFEIDFKDFHLTRMISANRARWQQNLKTFVWEQGTARDTCGVLECKVQDFTATTFPELDETPEDFLKEVKQDKQMNYVELRHYISDLKRSGYDTTKLQVQFYKKFSTPVFAFIMALISVPFGFLVGNRGAMAGIGVSLGVAITYFGVGLLFEQLGNVGQMPANLAAWSPDALFAVAGLYFMARMRS